MINIDEHKCSNYACLFMIKAKAPAFAFLLILYYW